jgi:hypothetical protein
MRKVRLIILAIFCLAVFIYIYDYVHDFLWYRKSVIDKARSDVEKITQDAAVEIGSILMEAVAAADTIAADFSQANIGREELLKRLQDTLMQNPYFYSGTITYKPYGYDPERRLYSAFYIKQGDTLRYEQLDLGYDYTKSQYDWYGEAMKKGTHWSEPYFDSVAKASMTTYSSVFYEQGHAGQKNKALGVVTIDITLQGMKQIIENLDLGPGGFGALLSRKGVYLYHPDRELVASGKTIAQLGKDKNDIDRIILSDKVVHGRKGIIDHFSSTTGLDSWLVYHPVEPTGWSLQNTFIKDDIPFNIDVLRQRLIWITFLVLVFLLLLLFLLSMFFKARDRKSWAISITVSVLFLVCIGVLWNLAVNYQSQAGNGTTNNGDMPVSGNGSTGAKGAKGAKEIIQISNRAVLKKFKDFMDTSHTNGQNNHKESLVYIPTGIFLESITFSDAHHLTIMGYIWQKYFKGIYEGIEPGVIISGAESLNLKEIFSREENGMKLMRWRFEAKIIPHFEYSRYPLEQEKISIRLLHPRLDKHIVLVPDLESYEITSPASLPGLDKELNLPGWFLVKSFFEARKENYMVDFGMKGRESTGNLYNLYFNIIIKKAFLDSFISHLTPLIVVAFLLFSILFISKSDPDVSKKLEAGAGKVLAFCAGLFFVVVFGHIDIRQKVSAEEIFYLEYFYLILYMALLWVSVNSIVFHLAKNLTSIQYKENIIAKWIYWPILLGLLAGVTFVTYY